MSVSALCSGRLSRKAVGAMTEKIYVAIDLKSFYASVECVELEKIRLPLTL